jgi:uncharacterized protein YPO0396
MDWGSAADWVGISTGWVALVLSAISLMVSNNFGRNLTKSQEQLKVEIQEEVRGELSQVRRMESQRVDEASKNLVQLTERLIKILERQSTQGGNLL